MTLASMIGYIAGSLTTISLLPQIAKAWKTRSVEDLSLAMLVIYASGLALWVFYGVLLGEPPIVLFNVITFLLAAALLAFKIGELRRKG
jgi:MtN3 and saliva related transmembrane protein